MGFMSGFADGFGRQIEAGQQRKAVKERDALTMAMDRMSKREAEYNEAKATDKKYQAAARQIALTNGLPEGAWVDIYGRLTAGDTFTGAEKWATGQEWSVEEQTPAMPDTPTPPQAPTGPTTPAGPTPPTTAQDQQMSDSGLAPGQAQTPGQTDPGILGSLAGDIGGVLGTIGNPQAQQERLMSQANEQAVSTMGLTEEEAARYTTGYQPNVPASSVTYKPRDTAQTDRLKHFNDEAVWVFGTGPDGKPYQIEALPLGGGKYEDIEGNQLTNVTRAMSKDGVDRHDDAINYVSKTTQPLAESKANVLSMGDSGMSMVEIVAEEPHVLTTAANVSTFVTTFVNEADSLFSQIGELVGPDVKAAEAQMVEAATANITGTDELSMARRQFESERISFVFALARAKNGPGPLTANDVAQAASIISTTEPTEFESLIQNLMESEANRYNLSAETAFAMDRKFQEAQAMGIDGIEEMFGPIEWGTKATDFLKDGLVEKPVAPPVPSPDQLPGDIPPDAQMVQLNTQSIAILQPKLPNIDLSEYENQDVYLVPKGDGSYMLKDSRGNIIAGDE